MATAEASLPDLETVRPLILEGLEFVGEVAALFGAPDTFANVLAGAKQLVQGAMFGIAWNFIRRRINRLPEAQDAAEDVASLQSAAPEGVSIVAILALIELVWGFIQRFRK